MSKIKSIVIEMFIKCNICYWIELKNIDGWNSWN